MFHLCFRGLRALWVGLWVLFLQKVIQRPQPSPAAARIPRPKHQAQAALRHPSAGMFSRRLCSPRQLILHPSSFAWAAGGQLPVFGNGGFRDRGHFVSPCLTRGQAATLSFATPSQEPPALSCWT